MGSICYSLGRNTGMEATSESTSGLQIEELRQRIAELEDRLAHAKRRNREQERLIQALGELADFGIWVSNPDGTIRYMSGGSLAELTSAAGPYGWIEALHPSNKIRALAEFQQCVRTGQLFKRSFTVIDNQGQAYSIQVRARPVCGDSGETLCWAGLNMDVSALHRSEEALQETHQALVRSNAELQEFAFAASHDLQEPLRAIDLVVHLFLKHSRGKLDEEQDRLLSMIRDSVGQMSQLVSDLLEYGRALHDETPLAPTDLNAAVKFAIENCRAAIDESEAEVNTEPLPQVSADRGQMVRVFQNLIGNGIKYRRDEKPQITVSAIRRGEEWRFCVADNGQGIPLDQTRDLFRPFKRLHGKDIPGSGLGLAMCRKIVERHGGRIWMDSTPGQGSRFYFTLPLD